MAKNGRSREWLLALIVGLVFVVAQYTEFPLLSRFEHMLYDAGVNMTPRKPGATEKIAIIAIDDASIERIGRWPWSRDVQAELLNKLQNAGSKVIGMQVLLTEPQTDAGLQHLTKIKTYLDDNRFPKDAQRHHATLMGLVSRGISNLDADGKLGRTIAGLKNLFLPMFFDMGEPLGKQDKALPDFVRKNQLTNISISDSAASPFPTNGAHVPLDVFGRHATGIGHITLSPDADFSGVRKETLLLEHYGEYYPSMALLMAAKSLNLRPKDLKVDMGKGIKLGKLYIKTDPQMAMLTGFYKGEAGRKPFTIYPFHQVRDGTIPSSQFRNKIVIIGPTASGVGNNYTTPVSNETSLPELTAHFIASILNQDFYTVPDWVQKAQWGVFAIVLIYLMLILPRVGAGFGGFLSFVMLTGLLGSGIYFLVIEKIWVQTVMPAMLLVTGHLVLTTTQFLKTEQLKKAVESDSAQSNRMLGLSFQAQGQLDMAMDKFRKLPVDDSVLDLIYNLALDFERKRQFGKACVAYDYILEHDKKFRDVSERKKRAFQAEGTIIIGGAGAGGGGTMMLDSVDQKPTLGRYEVEKELGKGAMGTVYLGRDPKINRVVAIKTMALSQEFEGKELESVKERFFREAETAGRLNHPNIVTIYDAGEDHDLAYIAMEFLEGKDLTNYISPMDQLPADWVMHVVGRIADALDYAHKQDVVHRDIKPANIMYNESTDTVKVTDFGIARITASSRTKTGVVLGTPSYMSPEQLAGKHVDGRSDLFSLGVMLYELLTSEQPFTGDSMAALMYQIANSKHPDISKSRPDLPSCAKTIIDKALHKDATKRFQTGREMFDALEKCIDKL